METGGMPIFSLRNRDEKNSAQNFPHINKSNVNFPNTGSNSRFFKMGNKRAIWGQTARGKKAEETSRCLPLNPFGGVSFAPGRGEVMPGNLTPTVAHCLFRVARAACRGGSIARRCESHGHEKHHMWSWSGLRS